MAPSHALVRRIGGEEKFTASIQNLYILSNYDLKDYMPKSRSSFSSNQLYGLKQSDENGVLKIIKCRILLLEDSEEAIKKKIAENKLPRCEPARFESSVQHTEDFSLFEQVKESKAVKESTSKRSSAKPAQNKSLSAKYMDKKQAGVDTNEVSKETSTKSPVRDSGKSLDLLGENTENKVTKAKQKNDRKRLATNDSSKEVKKSKLEEVVKNLKNMDSDGRPAQGSESEMQADKDTTLGSCEVTIQPDWENIIGVGKTIINMPMSDQLNQLEPASNTNSCQNEDQTFQSLSGMINELKEAVQKIQTEVSEMKEMTKTLLEIVSALKEDKQQPSGFLPVLSMNNCDPSGLISLGGQYKIQKDWAEKVVWDTNNPLKWKLEKLLKKLFDLESLRHFWFDKACIREEEGDKIFPEDCLEKVVEFFNESNEKRNNLEVLKQQKKIQERTCDPEVSKELCNQVYASIMLQSRPLEKQIIKFQIGKVLFDVRASYRKENNLPARKPMKKATTSLDETEAGSSND